jgi:hypothetical protein
MKNQEILRRNSKQKLQNMVKNDENGNIVLKYVLTRP